MLQTRDNWERLVRAVIKKQQIWELCHAHSRFSSSLSESSDLSSSSFREINTSSAQQVQKLVLVSDFVPAFDVDDVNLNSLKLLGTGTFGNTYVGDVSDGFKIVVKRINKFASVSEEEFKRSMDFVGSIRYENVVALRAYYYSEDDKLMMYDFYGRGSVYRLLHGRTRAPVGWQTRLRIATGAARGLASIHAQLGGKLVHGNVKSTNIFLDQGNYGCISDLGMINLIAAKFRQNERCHAPEVKNNTQNVSQESDVYSFGILLFELLTRKPSVQVLGGPNAVDLVKLVKSVNRMKMTSKVFDPHLLEDLTNREQMVRVLQIGIGCVVKSAKKRPKMSLVAKMLENLYVYNAPKRQGLVFVDQNVSKSDDPFDLKDLLRASADILEKGSTKVFYKVILESGMTVRVKIMKNMTIISSGEFEQHMDTVSRIKHVNCAELMAYHISKDRVLLVYNQFSHENLSYFLHNKLCTRKPLDWEARLGLALTAAEGIAHIHGLKLVHGNIKSSNIFVNGDNNAIITDAALWKVRKPVLSSQGYFAPEVKRTRNMSQASDVYSFGVVLLELLTRRSPQDYDDDDDELPRNGDEVTSLVSLVHNHLVNGLASKVLDPELLGYHATKEVLQLAMDCVKDDAEERPTMYAVVKRLKQIRRQMSTHYDSEHVRSRLEDALEYQLSKLTM